MYVMWLFFLFLLLVQIVGMIYCGIKRFQKQLGLANRTICFLFYLSVAYDLIFFIITMFHGEYLSHRAIFNYLLCVAVFVIYFIFLLFGLLIFYKDTKVRPTESRKKLHTVCGIVLTVLFVVMLLGEYKISQASREWIFSVTRVDARRAKKEAEKYLYEKYGDGRFTYKGIRLEGTEHEHPRMSVRCETRLEVLYTSSYVDGLFTVYVDVINGGIEDDLMQTYYQEKGESADFKSHITESQPGYGGGN